MVEEIPLAKKVIERNLVTPTPESQEEYYNQVCNIAAHFIPKHDKWDHYQWKSDWKTPFHGSLTVGISLYNILGYGVVVVFVHAKGGISLRVHGAQIGIGIALCDGHGGIEGEKCKQVNHTYQYENSQRWYERMKKGVGRRYRRG